jgi:hypothetical protein
MPSESFGHICAKRIVEAKKAFTAAGTTLMMSDIAKLIDETAAELSLKANWSTDYAENFALAQKAAQTLSKADSSQFGNRRDIPPTPEQVTAYSASIGYPLDGQEFVDSYAAKGWLVGKTKMKDWQAAVRNWKRNGWGHVLKTAQADAGKDYTKF